jgi:5-methylcytosine-specific restriction endonuclease McrA
MNTNQSLQYAIDGDIPTFYNSRAWRAARKQTLEADRHECQDCKDRGRYTRAVDVHHVKTIEEHPGLALSMTYTDGNGAEKKQLISLCTACHKKRHEKAQAQEPITIERW